MYIYIHYGKLECNSRKAKRADKRKEAQRDSETLANTALFSLIRKENRAHRGPRLQAPKATIDYPLSRYISAIAEKTYRIIRWLLNWGISAVSVISAFWRSLGRCCMAHRISLSLSVSHTLSQFATNTVQPYASPSAGSSILLPRQINLYVS